MDADSFTKAVSPLLKTHGFKKSNATWRREQNESIAVFHVQKSPWDDGTFYVNIGTYFHALGSDAAPTENKCHVRLRLDVRDPLAVVESALDWYRLRESLTSAAQLAEQDSKKGLVFHALRTVRPV